VLGRCVRCRGHDDPGSVRPGDRGRLRGWKFVLIVGVIVSVLFFLFMLWSCMCFFFGLLFHLTAVSCIGIILWFVWLLLLFCSGYFLVGGFAI